VVLTPATVRVDVVVTGVADRPVSTAVDGVLSSERIESLPLNGRNFLELAFLVPGNNPTPVFDPTKTNSVLIASAGQTYWFVIPRTPPIPGTSTRRNSVGQPPPLAACSDP